MNLAGTEVNEGEGTISNTATSVITTRHFTCPAPSSASLYAVRDELLLEGYETKITTAGNNGATYKLDATLTVETQDPTDPNASDDPEEYPAWEIGPNLFEQSLYECGRPLVANLPTGMKELIEARIKDPNKVTLFGIPPGVTITPTMWAQHDLITALRRMDISGRQNYYWTLRQTVTANSDWEESTWNIDNSIKVLSTSLVQSSYNVPPLYARFMPPSSLEYENTSFNEFTSPINIPFYYGWLEIPPQIQSVGGDRNQLSRYWIYNRWNVTYSGTPGLYDLVA